MPSQDAGISVIAKETGLTRQSILKFGTLDESDLTIYGHL
jgi:hypothetical protein